MPTYPATSDIDGRPFGDVGTYVRASNTLNTNTHDNILVWLDIEAVEDYYKNKSSGTPILTRQQMIDAGFNQACDDTEVIDGVTHTYATWLDIPYRVHTPDAQHDAFATVTAYERLIRHLTSCMTVSVPGDINLDGEYTDDDFAYATDVRQHYLDDSISCKDYILSKETSLGHNPSIASVYQRLYNGTLYSGSATITENDISVLRDMLSNIYLVSDYPVDVSVFAGNPATFSISLGKNPAIDNYIYDWKMTRLNGVVEQLGNIDSTPDKTSSRTVDITDAGMDASIISVTIYEPYVPNIPAGTPLTNLDYYHNRTYSCYLFVGDINNTLWGDTDNNGVVNVIDAYMVLNNYNYLRGDCDRNGSIDASDASNVLGYYANLSTGESAQTAVDKMNERSGLKKYTVEDFERCDMNQDGRTDASDASTILVIYTLASSGMTVQEIEQQLGIVIDPKDVQFDTHTKGELAALITTGSSKPNKITKVCGQAILETIKDNTKRLR